MAETLGSSFAIDYPQYEVIFCVARGDDPVVAVLRDLIAANPQVSARLLIGDDRLGANPKLNNIAKGWVAARHPWIVIADSNVVLPRGSLRGLMARWGRDTGAVCSMPIGSRPENFAAELECAFLNTLQARFQYVSERLGFGFAQGKTMLFRREFLDRHGGIGALAGETAEDAATTKIVRAAGYRVHLVDAPFEQPLGWRRAADVWARQLRWARLRRASFPWLFLPEILVGSALPAVALAVAAVYQGSSILPALVLLYSIWFGAEAGLALLLGWRLSLRLLAALLLRDVLLPILWVAAWSGSDFVWRGTAMHAQPSRELTVSAGFDAPHSGHFDARAGQET